MTEQHDSTADDATADESNVTAARRALGCRLAKLRKAAGYTQAELTDKLGYSRSAVASVETGHQQHASEDFWRQCDNAVDASGELLTEFERISELIRRKHREAAEVDRRARALRANGREPVSAIHRTFSAVASHGLDRDDLVDRVLDARDKQLTTQSFEPTMTMIGGYASVRVSLPPGRRTRKPSERRINSAYRAFPGGVYRL